MFPLLAAFGFTLLLVVAALAVPVDLEARATLDEKLDAGLRVGWLFGLVERDVVPPAARSGKPISLPTRAQIALLLRDAFRDRLAQLARRCKSAVEIGVLSGQARFGLGDPGETGYALGALLPIVELLSQHPRVELRIEPDWSQFVMAGTARGRARITPIGLVFPLVAFALSREFIHTVREWRRAER